VARYYLPLPLETTTLGTVALFALVAYALRFQDIPVCERLSCFVCPFALSH